MEELPIKIQTIVFRKNNQTEILLLKRNEYDGGFWQTVTGTLGINETIIESRLRELKEGAGIKDKDVLTWSEELYRFSWPKNDYIVVELVYAAEVAQEQEIVLSAEHTQFMWVDIEKAIAIIEKENTKNSLLKFKQWLI